MEEILTKSGLQIGEMIRAKKLSVTEAFEIHAGLISRFNPVLNAIVEDNLRNGLAKAKELDAQIKTQELGKKPFYGVPFTCKEMISVKNFKRTGGSYFYKDEVAVDSGTSIKRLEAQDMVLLGTTNVPEFGFWFETKNTVYGRTRNPYNEKRTSGGSSGGEGAIVGLGASPIGIGSDIGGSIRIPASFCGVFGHKPSYKLVPLTGHFPNTPESFAQFSANDYPLTVIGPIARKSEDLLPILKLMAGPDSIDRQCDTEIFKRLNKKPELKKVYVISDPIIHGTTRTDSEIKKAVENTAQYFEQLGYPVVELKSGFFKDSLMMWVARLNGSKRLPFSELISPNKGINSIDELSRLIMGKSRHTLPAFILSQLDGRVQDPEILERSLEQLNLFRSELNQMLGENNVLLFPTQPRTAPYHNELFLSPFDFIYAGIFNALEVPATNVPMGLDRTKMPMGVQVVGSWGNDSLTIHVASELEKAFGGWTPPEFYS